MVRILEILSEAQVKATTYHLSHSTETCLQEAAKNAKTSEVEI